jgi:hypothetical protein
VNVRLYQNTKITDAGLKELRAFKSLEQLQLGAKITDAGLKELKGLKRLKDLSLSRTQVTDAGLKELKELRGLLMLSLSVCPALLKPSGRSEHHKDV